jgi:hypothetical protein
MLRDFVARNFVAGPSGQCDGRTFDFLQRDALHYHVAAVQPLVEVALYAPDLVDRTTHAAVLSGLEFIRPFFLGHAEHVEFARTSVAFDRERRDDGNPVAACPGPRAAPAGQGGIPADPRLDRGHRRPRLRPPHQAAGGDLRRTPASRRLAIDRPGEVRPGRRCGQGIIGVTL